MKAYLTKVENKVFTDNKGKNHDYTMITFIDDQGNQYQKSYKGVEEIENYTGAPIEVKLEFSLTQRYNAELKRREDKVTVINVKNIK